MDFRVETISAEQARPIDLVEYLSKLGYEPSKIEKVDYWYLSPLRDEKSRSFKVNRNLYDHGLGKGGNIIDFAILYHNCTIGEFIRQLGGNFSFHQPPIGRSHQQPLEQGENQ